MSVGNRKRWMGVLRDVMKLRVGEGVEILIEPPDDLMGSYDAIRKDTHRMGLVGQVGCSRKGNRILVWRK